MLRSFEGLVAQYSLIDSGDIITVGVSGGADSVCLLLNLIEYSKRKDIRIKVVHINHLIREEAAFDARFVRDMCIKYGLEFYLFEEPVKRIAKAEGLSVEEAGRKVRYERLYQISEGGKVAVAHNSNDVAETVLFNIFRGTGLEGLASMEPQSGQIIRPLLSTTRQEIEEYLQNLGQEYVIDKSNLEDDYARNKIRNRILPYAQENISNNATAHVAALSEKMRLIRHYIEIETKKCFDRVVSKEAEGLSIDLYEFCELDILMRQQVVLLALDEMTSGRKDITQKHVEAIISIIGIDGEKRLDLPYNLEVVKQYGKLIIRYRTNQPEAKLIEHELEDGGVYDTMQGVLRVQILDYDGRSIEQNTYTKWFDYDKIVNCLMLRTRREGDYLTINSEKSKKSLKDYFINEKIPRDRRDYIPIVADGNHVLWVIGYRISEEYKVTKGTKRIIELSYEMNQ